jgi:hypothetical protein
MTHPVMKAVRLFEQAQSAIKEAAEGSPILVVLRSEDQGMTVDYHPRAEVIRYLARKEGETKLGEQSGIVMLENTSYVDWSKSEGEFRKQEGALHTRKLVSHLTHRPIETIPLRSNCYGTEWHDPELRYPALEIAVGERELIAWCKRHPMRAITLWKACQALDITPPAWKPLQDEVLRRRDEAIKAYKDLRRELQRISQSMKDMRLRANCYGARAEDFE